MHITVNIAIASYTYVDAYRFTQFNSSLNIFKFLVESRSKPPVTMEAAFSDMIDMANGHFQ